MPAWCARIGYEKAWFANKGQKPRQGDLGDLAHLAQLPYVDVFVTEGNMASLLGQARLGIPARVYNSIASWLDSGRRP